MHVAAPPRHAGSRPARCRAGTRGGPAALAVALGLGCLLAAGCGSLDDAQQVADRADLVNDLAVRMGHAGDLTYTADYQLPEGGTARIAQGQDPARVLYVYPGGQVSMTAEASIECRQVGGGTTCAVTNPAGAHEPPPAALLRSVNRRGMITPDEVIALFTATALDTEAVIEQHDTTIAAQHATCVDVHNLHNATTSLFTACITTDGILGSFTGQIGGTRIDVTMIRYRDTVDASAFDTPPDAAIVDQRRSAK